MTQVNETCPAELPNWCAQRHWSIFWILIVASLAVVAGRVLVLGGVSEKNGLPFFSANDRSRWITVRSLVDHGTFEMDPVLASENGRQWDSIDKVRQVGRDGQFHYYSSKPPLLTLFVAAGYQMLKWTLGWEIATDTVWVVRVLLLVLNVGLWAIYLWFVARMINSVPVRDWARYYILGCAGFATFLGVFTNSLNNHLPAAVGVMVALYCVSEIIRTRTKAWGYFVGAGLAGALAATNELPAVAFVAATGAICVWYSIRRTMLGFVPPVLVVLAVSLASNWWAWGDWKPAYAQRKDGPVVARVSGDFHSMLDRGELPKQFRERVADRIAFVEPIVERGSWPDAPLNQLRWVVRDLDPRSVSQMAIVSEPRDAKPEWNTPHQNDIASEGEARMSEYQLRAWGNWYDYPGSYWLDDFPRKSAIDRGEPLIARYAFHLLFGHHGLFSLTPLWLLSFAGMFALIGGAKMGGRFQMRWLGGLAVGVTAVVFGFYLTLPTTERNYGGVCCTARWLLWLVPIWLMSMLPIVDWLGGSRWGRFVCFGLLFLSALSASVHANNPWTYPWLYAIWAWTGLPG